MTQILIVTGNASAVSLTLLGMTPLHGTELFGNEEGDVQLGLLFGLGLALTEVFAPYEEPIAPPMPVALIHPNDGTGVTKVRRDLSLSDRAEARRATAYHHMERMSLRDARDLKGKPVALARTPKAVQRFKIMKRINRNRAAAEARS